MTDRELQAIKQRAEYATQGPWKVFKSQETGVQIGTEWEHGQLKAGVPVVTTAHGVGSTTIYINHDNAEFIAHAREDIPTLITEVERYKQVYEICERGMFKAHDKWQETQARLDAVELAEAKARMEVERLREALEEIESSSAGDFDAVRLTARQALED